MSTDSQNPRYSYLTLNRSIVGTDSFELDVAGSTVYRLDTNTSTVNIKFNNSGNDQIPLISKRRIDVGSNGFTKIIVSWTGIAVAETLQLLIADSEASSTDIGVELSDYSTSLTGAITIGGTVDVDIVGQTGADPINVNISSQTGADPINNNLNQIGGSTANATSMGNTFDINNPDNTVARGWSYLVTGSQTIFTATADTYITSCSLTSFGLSVTDNTIMLQHQNSASGIITVLLVWIFNSAQTGQNRGTFGLTHSFPIPYKLVSGEKIVILGGANSWSSGQIVGVST